MPGPIGRYGNQPAPASVNNRPGNFGPRPAAAPSGPPILTPAQQAAARQKDIDAGQARFAQLMNDPAVKDIQARREQGLQGLNSQEMQAARDQMALGMQGQQQGALRGLLAQQARSGLRGGMAGAQQAQLYRKMGQDRQAGEQKLLLDNYALKNQGLDKYQDFMMRQKFGSLAQGLGEAGLGVSDRTGYMQQQIGQQMAAAAGQTPSRGLFGQLLGGLF